VKNGHGQKAEALRLREGAYAGRCDAGEATTGGKRPPTMSQILLGMAFAS
jgi:hypothetical protein